jgi:hypothetical protein
MNQAVSGVLNKRCIVPNEINVLALIKGEEHYVFVYDDASRADLIDAFRDQAANPMLSLTWFDAMVLTTKAREQAAQGSGFRDEESEVRDQESEETMDRRFL